MIRELTKQDFQQWSALRLLLWPDCPIDETEEAFHFYFSKARNKRQKILVTENEAGNLIAFLEGAIRSDYVEGADTSPVGYVEGIFVVMEYRNWGIGQSLVDQFSFWLKSKNITEMGSDCDLDNTASLRFHMAIGFKKASRNIHFIKKLS